MAVFKNNNRIVLARVILDLMMVLDQDRCNWKEVKSKRCCYVKYQCVEPCAGWLSQRVFVCLINTRRVALCHGGLCDQCTQIRLHWSCKAHSVVCHTMDTS